MCNATVVLLVIYLLTGLARHQSSSSRAHRLRHGFERFCIFSWLSYLLVRCRTVEILHLTLCCICRPSKCSYCSSTGHCLPHECRVGSRRPSAPMVVEPWCFDVIIWSRVTAVGNIGQEVIVLGIVAPAPPPTIWGENDRVKPIPCHSTRPTVSWVVRILIILIIHFEHAIQFTLADETVDPLLARFTLPVGIGYRPIL